MSKSDIERLTKVVSDRLQADVTATDPKGIVLAVLQSLKENPGRWALDHLGDGMGDRPQDHERAPFVWEAVIDEIIDEDDD